MLNGNKYLGIRDDGWLILLNEYGGHSQAIAHGNGYREGIIETKYISPAGLELDNNDRNRVTIESLRKVAPEWADKVEEYEANQNEDRCPKCGSYVMKTELKSGYIMYRCFNVSKCDYEVAGSTNQNKDRIMKEDGTSENPFLRFCSIKNQWHYKNGCVDRYFDDPVKAQKKFVEFIKHPDRHMKFWNEQSGIPQGKRKVLGVDVDYDAWKEDEKAYELGQWFKHLRQGRFILSTPESNKIVLTAEDGARWSNSVDCKDTSSITTEEYHTVCGYRSSIKDFTPINVEIKEV